MAFSYFDNTENFFVFLWEEQLFDKTNLKTSDGKNVKILRPGLRNTNSGADFFNALITIDDTKWAGNVEIHTKASDWYKHGHNNDEAYDNVILHVVGKCDKKTVNSKGTVIPCLEIKFDTKYWKRYNYLITNDNWARCKPALDKTDEFVKKSWLTKLAIERMMSKTQIIEQKLNDTKNNWEQIFYEILARNFGFSTNADAFERVAKSIQLIYLAKHKDNLLQIEALLFGQAGFLEQNLNDEYFSKLKNEYRFLSKKFSLTPIDKHLWKFMRLRPYNFPTVRIAQFAALIHKSSKLFSKIIAAQNTDEIKKLFDVKASAYWDTHYNFGKKSTKKIKKLGSAAIDTILINTVLPIIFIYGKMHDNIETQEKAIDFMQEIKPEKNSVIKNWHNSGYKAENALETQALLHLRKEYCDKNKCTDCQIGAEFIKYITI